jgi:threonylcarbamoyladenosine tRNA methylthiotransferase MtaB
LHIPVQSGCDAVLTRMGRPYLAAEFAALVTDAKGLGPGICIGSDVMVGFPGETGAEFEQTRQLLAELPISYLHVFAYSRRPQTPAAEMPDQVAPEAKRERSRILRALSDARRAAFAEEQRGAVVEVALERLCAGRGGWLEGVTDSYLRASIRGPEERVGTLQRGRVVGVHGDCLELAHPDGPVCAGAQPGSEC